MKLIYRIALRLSLALLPIMAIWAAVFYFMLVDEINDESDDALENYSELIISRMLSGRALPPLNDGSNNSYTIVPVDEEYAAAHADIEYYDAEIFIPEKHETEPARIMTTVFSDNDGIFYELKVAMPSFEREDLIKSILYSMVTLYLLLMVTIIAVTILVFYRSMRPLYALLAWLDGFSPGRHNAPVPDNTDIDEFRRLNSAAQRAAERTEKLFEQQKQFIGNASHELQTPLAVIGNRLEWLLDNTNPDRTQTDELLKMQKTLRHIVKLNRTLLLLTRIDNGQFPESSQVDIAATVGSEIETYDEIYAQAHGLTCRVAIDAPLTVFMNESLALTLVTNLLKNAYVHSPENGNIEVTVGRRTLTVANDGAAPLDAEHIFDRFHQGAKKEGSTGLGLAIVSAICRYYNLGIRYRFVDGKHTFTVTWP